jgi:carbon-monoxide dehydrogenase small subunit
MLLGGYALLLQNPQPTAEEVRTALAGHLCRCTGYTRIIGAVQDAAREHQP